MKLKEGDTAPDFTLEDQNGNKVCLSDYLGKKVILYFYHKDNTPLCEMQAKDFTKSKDEIERLNAVVFGISNDDKESHKSFCEQHNLNVTLLCDVDKTVSEKYDVLGEHEWEGNKYIGINRSTFIVDEEGVLLQVIYDQKAEDTVSDVMNILKS